MSSLIAVHPNLDADWPWAADHLKVLWEAQGPLEFVRLPDGDGRTLSQVCDRPQAVRRAVALGVPLDEDPPRRFPELREIAWTGSSGKDDPRLARLKEAGVRVIRHTSEGFWGQSVSEFGLALTLCGLRRIPQTHHEIQGSLEPWNYRPPGNRGRPGARGGQYGDDSRFTNGTLEGKRVRIVGAGNIASRYAHFCTMLGAEVAAWDPFASEPCFHRAGARREHFLERLVLDAEIFAPMVPLNESTRGLVKAAQIRALPTGCLVVLVTRARICDTQALYERVLNDELALAADVFAEEPLPLGHPLLGRANVVHTPHNAGRTRQANERFAQMLAEQFQPS